MRKLYKIKTEMRNTLCGRHLISSGQQQTLWTIIVDVDFINNSFELLTKSISTQTVIQINNADKPIKIPKIKYE